MAVSAKMEGALPDAGSLRQWYGCRDVDICALEMEVTMEWNTDFKVSTTVIVAIYEVELNMLEFCDLNRKPDGDATGITDISTSGYVPVGECWIWLNVADDTGLYNTARKQIIVTGAPNIATGANEITGSIRLCECGGWMVFNRNSSTAYPDTGPANVSWTWGTDDIFICSGLGSVSWIIDCDTTEILTVIAGNVCTGLSVPSYPATNPEGGRIYSDASRQDHKKR